MRTFAAVTVTGVAGMVLFKLLAAVVFPILGLLLGLFFMTVKLALIAGVIFFIYSIIRKRQEEQGEEDVEAQEA